MAHKARKTEHTGAKHGSGAYWGTKAEAKKESSKIRRRSLKLELKRGSLAKAESNLAMAKEWFPLEEEVLQKLNK